MGRLDNGRKTVRIGGCQREILIFFGFLSGFDGRLLSIYLFFLKKVLKWTNQRTHNVLLTKILLQKNLLITGYFILMLYLKKGDY